ncbi:class I SAM-dependent DNA methyltransferase [Nocardiopsis changdeensis]|uniref:Class I SAM-dependent methyltransferase n=1 Tax=Nocardiopsis changdeensis TaxID=2831969 RepID=A0ABX8BMX9_9ACTN|nr:class I SAM-dependent methyltransferase [Nocardiopsis changdeensis]QYX39384.1 class I SAM-dependent methyltransferase [Nocardiopsis sp. MT53]
MSDANGARTGPKPNHFDTDVAEHYDTPGEGMFAPDKVDPAVDLLAGLAGEGRALEFAVGTGRIALPLAARGVPVHGIDLSPAMVEQMRAKPGGGDIDVVIGDFATTRVPGEFSLVYLVFNTINNVTTQDEQVECFVNAAAHLGRGGRFVVEVGVPELRRLPKGQNMVPFHAGEEEWAFDLYEPATQLFSSNYVSVADGRGSLRSVPFRYVWPAELDLMARIAGMRLVERWQDWDRTPFGDESEKHVSVWEKVLD